MNTKSIQRRSEIFLMEAGALLFILGLFNRKTRALLIKFLGFGVGMVADYTLQKYLPQHAYQPARVVPNVLSLYGSKGGKATKKRTFKHLKRSKDNLNAQQSRFFTKYSVS